MRRNTTLMTMAAMALCASPPAEPVSAPEPETNADPAPEYPNRQQRRQAERMAKKGRTQ